GLLGGANVVLEGLARRPQRQAGRDQTAQRALHEAPPRYVALFHRVTPGDDVPHDPGGSQVILANASERGEKKRTPPLPRLSQRNRVAEPLQKRRLAALEDA